MEKKIGDTAMQILQVPDGKEIVKAYKDGYITLNELKEQMECHWDRKIYKGTKAPVIERSGDPETAT
jgi:hypothetical protein